MGRRRLPLPPAGQAPRGRAARMRRFIWRPGLRGRPVCFHRAGATGPSGADAPREEAAA